MKDNNNFAFTRAWTGKVAVLALFAGLMTACSNQDQPDVVVVTPTTPAAPAPTTTVTPIATVTPTATITPTATVAPTAATSPGTTTTRTTTVITEPITDVVVISSAPQPATLVGKRVQFTGTRVVDVIGDRPFLVGRSNNESLAVVLDPALDQGSAEQKVKIRSGQTLDLTGVLKASPSAATAQKQWGLTAEEAQTIQNQGVYLQADKINFK